LRKVQAEQKQGKTIHSFSLWLMDSDGKNAKFLAAGCAGSWSPDGKRILFDKRADLHNKPQLCIMDADGSNKISLGKEGTGSGSWSPDGKRITYMEQRVDIQPGSALVTLSIFVMNIDGSSKTLLHKQAGLSTAQWSGDGKRVYFTVIPGSVCVIEADGRNFKQLTRANALSMIGTGYAYNVFE
jgi:Tol biopolymer transport system component